MHGCDAWWNAALGALRCFCAGRGRRSRGQGGAQKGAGGPWGAVPAAPSAGASATCLPAAAAPRAAGTGRTAPPPPAAGPRSTCSTNPNPVTQQPGLSGSAQGWRPGIPYHSVAAVLLQSRGAVAPACAPSPPPQGEQPRTGARTRLSPCSRVTNSRQLACTLSSKAASPSPSSHACSWARLASGERVGVRARGEPAWLPRRLASTSANGSARRRAAVVSRPPADQGQCSKEAL